MTTERLYYDQPYLAEFRARVVSSDTCTQGYRVKLDRTAFYPTSGGQPNDLGSIGEAQVLDVIEEGDDIVCVVDRDPAPLAGGGEQPGRGGQPGDGLGEYPLVKCHVDWERRFDLMQQHTGQHVLSSAFEKVLDADTVGFHLTERSLTVDLNISSLPPTGASSVEALANRIVFEDRPVTAVYPTQDELARMPLRKPPTRAEGIRIIVVGDFDHSPCGGTHVSTTGQVGIIKVTGWEKTRAGMRAAFVCGSRAVADFGVKNDVTTRLGAMLSVPLEEIEPATRRLLDQNAQYFKRLESLTKELLGHEAASLAAGGPIVAKHFEARDPGELRMLAGFIVAEGGKVAVLGSSAPSPQVIIARSDDVAVDARQLIEVAKAVLGGRGGGNPRQAQAGGQDPATVGPAVEAVRREALRVLGLGG